MCNEYDIKAKIPPINNAAEHPEIDYMSDRNAAIRLIKLYGEDGVKEWKKKVNYGLCRKFFLATETNIRI
ncbi:hypothetical protein [Wolbachia endosymbiont (group A) of Agelastica alni]|uniref:hypothetical protein n=1 Tax=Wolbachia endosymbiont (group A) of Agelastica alni TaxID=3066130 RepID=UPI0033409EC2